MTQNEAYEHLRKITLKAHDVDETGVFRPRKSAIPALMLADTTIREQRTFFNAIS